MSKVFRLYTGGATTYQDWNNSPAFPYNSTSRDTIEDPDGGDARNEITSIPSPFARIDLVKAAFKEVSKSGDLDGKTIYHKMVSDTLDVAEIFFNHDKFRNRIEIIKWDPNLMLAELSRSDLPGHRYLADALEKYKISDAATYNFNQLKNIYLLNYKSGPQELNIIGATSPATLFFSNANDLSYVNDIFFGEDKPFDKDYQPLYKRDFEFVKYLFALRNANYNFASLFPEIDNYLEKTFSMIRDQEKKEELRNISATELSNLSEISVADIQQNDYVEVLGIPLYQKSSAPASTISDFTIQSSLATALKPLVLPIESGNRYSALQYTTGKWGKTNKAPFSDPEQDLTKRVLPFDGLRTPYLTIGDFLEDSIVRVPHTLNTQNYFDGNLKLDANKKELAFLFPIKPLLFEYFTPEEIRGNMEDGKPMVEMQLLSGDSIKATLRIPIKGAGNIRYIEYTRTYYHDSAANTEQNYGGMTEFKFTGFIMPQIKFIEEHDAIYNVSCVQSGGGRVGFKFFRKDEQIFPKSITCRCVDKDMMRADNYLLEGVAFDFIQVNKQSDISGVLLPIFKQQKNIEHFEFAIDLGTSNTHIEYRKGDGSPEVFTVSAKDRQLCEMFVPGKNDVGQIEDLIEETELIEKDFIPAEVGDSDFHFPTRTVLSCAKTISWRDAVEPFTLVNLPFTYDKRSGLDYNNFKYNIKWGHGDEFFVMEAYVKCLMSIIRNKVLLNDGDLKRTKITWFYPISMAPIRRNKLKETWNAAYAKYFGQETTSCMTESSAPIQYFFRRYATAKDLVNVDIGGGTTDIAFAKDKKITHVTSFRFASNALFENSFSELDENNGIVDWHKKEILKALKEKNMNELIRVFQSQTNTKPANMASFLFGLKDNTLLKKARINDKTTDFNFLLNEDGDFKIVFIIFYTAIIYHLAQIVKSLGLEVPRHISFSGNGSKVIRVITSDSRLLAKYTKIVFEKVLGKPYGKELELLGLEKDSNPKESTCKGGIISAKEEEEGTETIVFKSDCSGLVSSADTYATIDANYKRRTVKAVEEFFSFVLDTMNSAFKFNDNFGAKTEYIKLAKETAQKDLLTFLEKGITQRLEEVENDNMIEETLFYYPLKGVLNAISTEIYNKLQQSKPTK